MTERHNPFRNNAGAFRLGEQVMDKALRDMDLRTSGRAARVRANVAMAVDYINRDKAKKGGS
jgi:hypothetical protein